MIPYKKGSKVLLEGEVCEVLEVNEEYNTLTVKLWNTVYKDVPLRLIVARRLPAISQSKHIGEEFTLQCRVGELRFKIIAYRTSNNFDVEIVDCKGRTDYASKEDMVGVKLYRTNKDLLVNCIPSLTQDDTEELYSDIGTCLVFSNGSIFNFKLKGDYCCGNFNINGMLKDIYLPTKIVKSGEYHEEDIMYSADCNEIAPDGDSPLDYYYGGIDNHATAEDYKRGFKHYIGLRVMLKNGKFGNIVYALHDESYVIQLEDYTYTVASDVYFVGEKIMVGDIYYSTGGELLTVIESDKKVSLVSYTSQLYTEQTYLNVLKGKVGRKSYDYTGDTLVNRLGQRIEITKYDADSELSIRFESSEELHNVSTYGLFGGTLCDGGFEYDAKQDAIMCGKYAQPEILNFDTVINRYICKAGELYGTPEYITKMGIRNEHFTKPVKTAQEGRSYTQKCLLNAKIIGGWSDDNLVVQFSNGERVYNVSKKDLEEGNVFIKGVSESIDMFDCYILYEQVDGSVCQICTKYNDMRDILLYRDDTITFMEHILVDDVYSGKAVSTLEKGKVYENKFGMKYLVKLIKGRQAYILFEDKKSVNVVQVTTKSSDVVPNYMEGATIGTITNIKCNGINVVSEEFEELNAYNFTGVCSECGKVVEGDVYTLQCHRC